MGTKTNELVSRKTAPKNRRYPSGTRHELLKLVAVSGKINTFPQNNVIQEPATSNPAAAPNAHVQVATITVKGMLE